MGDSDATTPPSGDATTPASGDATTPPSGDGAASWAELPESARAAILDVAARVLGSLEPAQAPSALARVARFAPAKRAKAGAAPLARAVAEDAAFRALVAGALPATFGADSGDPIRVAARAFLLRLPMSPALLEAAAEADELTELRRRVADLSGIVATLNVRLAVHSTPSPGESPVPVAGNSHGRHDPEPEVVRLRGRLREQGSRLRMLSDEADRRVAGAEAARDEALDLVERERTSAERWRHRAEQETRRADHVQEANDRTQSSAAAARADADRRIELLLDTVSAAALGLRREWQLASGGADPADVVARTWGEVGAQPVPSPAAEPASLLRWLALPGAHLIVDGYNVTKTGYPELDLAVQRDRLTRALTSLAARVGAETTVVFDGAAVVVPTSSNRRVRVVFSPPGIIADDVIRKLAAAEPGGRVVIVVSSDREVADAVRRSGARVAPAAVLLEILA